MQEIDDMELVKRAQAGDIAAVGELYDRHRTKIFRYIRSKVFNAHLAQDLTGDVFLRMVDHLPEFRPMGVPFSAWLYQIARNLIIQHGQKENKSQIVSLVHANNVSRNKDNPALVVERKVEMEWVLQGLEKIDEFQREVIILRFIVGLSLKETAEMLNKTIAAVKSLQHRGILALQVTVVYV